PLVISIMRHCKAQQVSPGLVHHASHPSPGASLPMTRPLRVAVIACASYLLLAHPASTAPVELDPPAVDSPVDIISSATIHLDVTAGNSGAPNGFTVEWMTLAQFDALGDVWPEDPNDPTIQRAVYLGFPSLNTVEGTTTFMLPSNAIAAIELGDIFDETG